MLPFIICTLAGLSAMGVTSSCEDEIWAQNMRNFRFSKMAVTVDINDSRYRDDVNITWLKTQDPVKCASRAFSVCCRPKGFLFDSSTGSCGAVLWGEQAESGLPVFGSGERSLYRFRGSACKTGFQEYQYFNGGHNITTCLSLHTDQIQYGKASKTCKNTGAFLASTKTLEKLSLLASLGPPDGFWVGLDPKATSLVFVWLEDGTVLSAEKTLELFKSGEPSTVQGRDCAYYRPYNEKLANRACAYKMFYFCETKPGC